MVHVKLRNLLHLSLWLGLIAPGGLHAQVFMTQGDALKKAFSSTETQRKALFLTDEQAEKIESLSRTKLDSKILTYYIGTSSKGIEGYAFFLTSIVRTMPATFMVVVDGEGAIRFVEILAFAEPLDYLPTGRWFRLFEGRKLDRNLRVRVGIPNVTGASLSANAITDGVRKMLAVHAVAIRGDE